MILLFFLIKLVKKALDLYNAFKDTILKSHALFLGLYLILKSANTLIQILRYQGRLLQDDKYISLISFFNDMAVVFFYIACSLNLHKWLVIINRVYLYAGRVTEKQFKLKKKMNVGFYVFFVVCAGGVNITYMCMDLVENI